MSAKGEVGPRPKSMSRPKKWSEEVEEAYRFQLAGYRDAAEYAAIKGREVRTPLAKCNWENGESGLCI